MTWLTWRQHRTEVLVVGLMLGVLGVVVTVMGLDMATTYQKSRGGVCRARVNNATCAGIVDVVRQQFEFWRGCLL